MWGDESGLPIHTSARPAQAVYVVTPDLMRWGDPTEVAAAMEGLAQSLAAAGHTVTLLWVPRDAQSALGAMDGLAEFYKQNYLINLRLLSDCEHFYPGLDYPEKRSAALYFFLKEQFFDACYFALEGGLAYYTLTARETGLISPEKSMCVVAQSPVQWFSEYDKYFLGDLASVSTAHMERYCVEASQELVCLSRALLEWMQAKGWSVPSNASVLPAPLPIEWGNFSLAQDPNESIRAADELVLLGGATYKDGSALFCDALDELAKLRPAPLTVTAFGPFGHTLGEHTGGMLLRRANRWPFNLRIFPKLQLPEALQYIKDREAVAVIPSTASATGHWVSACIEQGVRFVTTGAGANGEQLSKGQRAPDAVRDAKGLAQLIVRALKKKLGPKAGSVFSDRRRIWGGQFDRLNSRSPDVAPANEPQPLVSIVMVHHERPQYLLQAIAAVEHQDYSNIELIVVDDGSRSKSANSLLDRLQPQFESRGWTIIRQENKYLGAARNAGVRAAKGELILFVDDDNALFRSAVSIFVGAMESSRSDICTAFHRTFFGETIPTDENKGFIQYIALGGSLDLGLILDSFGDANAMIRRSVFDRIGFQIEDYGYTAHDWEFFTRASLAGLKLRIIPEPVYWYRGSAAGMYRSSHWYDNRLPILSAFKSHGYKGLDHAYHLIVAAHAHESERLSYRENLKYSASDERYLTLTNLDPNSAEAMTLLAQIAASEGRADTALTILGRTGGPGFGAAAFHALSLTGYADQAVTELAASLTSDRHFLARELAGLQAVTNSVGESETLSYVEEPDRYYLQARDERISVAILPAACPRSVLNVQCTACLDQDPAALAEVRVIMLPLHRDPLVAVEQECIPSAEGDSGWVKLRKPYWQVEVGAKLTLPNDQPMSLVLAVRKSDLSHEPALACFSKITVRSKVGSPAARRTRIGPPSHKLRSRLVWQEDREKAKLLTHYQSELPLLMVNRGDGSIFLRPHPHGPVVAAIEGAFPAFARSLVGTVIIAHEDASPFEFAIALSMPGRPLAWNGALPENYHAFSGWLRVDKPFVLREVKVRLDELLKSSLTINLAIRLPSGSSPAPAGTYWRRLALIWDD